MLIFMSNYAIFKVSYKSNRYKSNKSKEEDITRMKKKQKALIVGGILACLLIGGTAALS